MALMIILNAYQSAESATKLVDIQFLLLLLLIIYFLNNNNGIAF